MADSNNHYNIDERLDRLTARHEALAQSLELLVLTVRDNEKRFAEHAERIDKRFEKMLEMMTRQYEATQTLLKVAEGHERRITDLEDGRQ